MNPSGREREARALVAPVRFALPLLLSQGACTQGFICSFWRESRPLCILEALYAKLESFQATWLRLFGDCEVRGFEAVAHQLGKKK